MKQLLDNIIKHIIELLNRWAFTRKYVGIVLNDENLKYMTKGGGIAGFFKIVALPLGLATSLIISRWYGADAMGMYSLIITIVAVISVMGLAGLSHAMPRFIGEAKALKTHEEKAVWRSSVSMIVLSSIVLSLLVYFGAGWISHSVFDEPRLVFPLQVLALFIFPLLWYKINTEYLLAQKKIWYNELITKAIVPGTLLGIVFISFWIWPTYYIPIWGYFIANTVGLGYGLYILWKYGYVSIRGPQIKRKRLLKISTPMLLTGVARMLISKTDILMLGWLSDTAQVGVYQVILSLTGLIPVGLSILGAVIKPQFAELYRAEKKQELQKVITASSFVISLIALIGFLILMFFPHFILSLWGAEFATPAGVMALRVLSVGFLVHGLCGNNGLYMNSTGNEYVLQKIVITVGIINLTLNLILIPLYGIVGAGLATMSGIVLMNVSASWWIWKKDGVRTFFWWR